MGNESEYEIRLFEGKLDGIDISMSVDPDRVVIQTVNGSETVTYGYRIEGGEFFVNQVPAMSHQIEEFQALAGKISDAAESGQVLVTVMVEDKG
jgi:hypothetical protein